MRRGYLLLEVLVGLALLATLGLLVLRAQQDALRQAQRSLELRRAVAEAKTLLWSWSTQGEPITLPTDGAFDARLRWKREVRPDVILGQPVTRITLRILRDEAGTAREVLRLDWLAPQPRSQRPEQEERS